MKKAVITIFTAMIFAAMLPLIMILLEEVRVNMLRTRLLQASESALDSVFAGYDGDMLDVFQLMLIDEHDIPGFQTIEEEMKYYLDKELSSCTAGELKLKNIEVLDKEYVVEQGGVFLLNSILEFMKYRIIGMSISTFSDYINNVEEAESAVDEYNEQQEGEACSEDEKKMYDSSLDKSWIDKINALREGGWLELIVPFNRVVSEGRTQRIGYPSVAFLSKAQNDRRISLKGIRDTLLTCTYISEYFLNFTTARENPELQYELEYILNGNSTDKENLKGTIDELLIMRECMNIAAVLKEPVLREAAESLAASLAGWTGMAPVVALTEAAVVGAWSYAEAIVDVRSLLSGHKIPLVKDAQSWSLYMESLFAFVNGDKSIINDSEKGLLYKNYIMLLLYKENTQKLMFRCMDMIKGRLKQYKNNFNMSKCIYSASVEVSAVTEPVFFRLPDGAYKLKIRCSRMY